MISINTTQVTMTVHLLVCPFSCLASALARLILAGLRTPAGSRKTRRAVAVFLSNRPLLTTRWYLLGTSSDTTKVMKVSWFAAASPVRTEPPIRVGMLCTRAPTKPVVWPPMRKYRRPRTSPRWPACSRLAIIPFDDSTYLPR